jgi:hypothetical protein
MLKTKTNADHQIKRLKTESRKQTRKRRETNQKHTYLCMAKRLNGDREKERKERKSLS